MSEQLEQPTGSAPSLWTQFEDLIGLHKFYFEQIIKAGAFYLGTVGIILTYIISAGFEEMLIPLILVFPLLLSIGALIISAMGIYQTKDLLRSVNRLQEELQITWRLHTEVLVCLTFAFTLLSALVTIGISWLILRPSLLT